jgi:peptide/nickel transport system permease protein
VSHNKGMEPIASSPLRSRCQARLRRGIRLRLRLWRKNNQAIRQHPRRGEAPQSMLNTLFSPRHFPIFSLIILGWLLVIPGVFAPQIAPHDPHKGSLGLRLKPPMWVQGGRRDFPLGTDKVGRDLLSRLIYGARVALTVSTVAIVMSGCLGLLLAVVAGSFGPRVDALIQYLQTPSGWSAMAVFLGVTCGLSPWPFPLYHFFGVTLIFGVLLWPVWSLSMRQVWSAVRSLRPARLYRQGPRGGGAEMRLLCGVAMLQGGLAIVLLSCLSFLGMGFLPPTPTWGRMVGEGWERIGTAWWLPTFPGLAIVLTVVSCAQVSGWLQGQRGSDSQGEAYPIFQGLANRTKYVGAFLGASALFMIVVGLVEYMRVMLSISSVPLVPR